MSRESKIIVMSKLADKVAEKLASQFPCILSDGAYIVPFDCEDDVYEFCKTNDCYYTIATVTKYR